MKAVLFFSMLAVFTSCNGQQQALVQPATTLHQITGDTVTVIDGEIRSVFQDAGDNIWFGTNGGGVYKYNVSKGAPSIVQFTAKHGLCSDYVWMITPGKDGNLWFTTRDAVCCFDGHEFTTVEAVDNKAEAIYDNFINADVMSSNYYNGKTLIKIQLPHTSPVNREQDFRQQYDIYCTCKDSKGNLWFGTCGAGVCKYDGTTYTWLNYKELGAPVRSIFEDKNGSIWIGNNGYGLLRYDPPPAGSTNTPTFTNFTKENHLENPDFLEKMSGKEGTLARVWSITDDKDGNLWIATIDAGVWMFDGKKLTNYTTKDGLGTNFIWTIYRDKHDRLWFGTDGFGVYTLDTAVASGAGRKNFIPFSGKKTATGDNK